MHTQIYTKILKSTVYEERLTMCYLVRMQTRIVQDQLDNQDNMDHPELLAREFQVTLFCKLELSKYWGILKMCEINQDTNQWPSQHMYTGPVLPSRYNNIVQI